MNTRVVDLSVVIPTCDRTELLRETVKSVLAQTVLPREIIVVDNGDAAPADAALSLGDVAIRLVRQEPQGVQAARNAGVAAATSTWIALLDDDDLYEPDFLASCRPALIDARADIVCTDHRKFDAAGDHAQTNFAAAPPGYWDGIGDPAAGWSYVDRFPIDRLLHFVPFYPSQLLLRRSLYQQLGGYDVRLRDVVAEDVEFLVRALGAGTLSIVWSPLLRYRVHAAAHSTGFDAQTWGRWTVFNHLRREAPALDPTFATALERALPRLRARAFDAAFGLRRSGDVLALARELSLGDWTGKRVVKAALAGLSRGASSFARPAGGAR